MPKKILPPPDVPTPSRLRRHARAQRLRECKYEAPNPPLWCKGKSAFRVGLPATHTQECARRLRQRAKIDARRAA